jgi:hypothetical protein
VLKNLRISIFNWFAAGKMTLTKINPEEYKPMSTYTIGGSGAGQLSINPNGTMSYGYNTGMQTKQTLTLKITPANGGTIVQTFTDEYSNGSDLHIIPDGVDFDRELGKIITLNKLRS